MRLFRCNVTSRTTSHGTCDVNRSSSFRTAVSPAADFYAREPADKGKTPWRDARYCVVDLELSGLDPLTDEIISYAAVPIDSGRVMAGGALYGLCLPTRPLPERSTLIHGIRTIDLVDAPPLDEAIQPLIAAMAGRVLVAHVAWVERAFIRRVFERQRIRLREPILDTCELSKLLAFERNELSPPRDLSGLAQSLALPVHREHHALGDALTTAQVFIALATHLDSSSSETVRSLAQATKRMRSHRS